MFEDMCRDMNKLCATMTDRPVYGIGLGDLIHEDANMWEIYRSGVKTLSFPMFGVIGNHDHDTKAPTDGEAIRPYEENIGPTNYSFDLGRLHFICLDNIVMKGDGAGGYSDGLSDEVYTWLCNDLKYVPKEKMIMICSHSSMFGKPGKDPVDVDKNGRLYAQKLSEYKYVHSWAGHSHINFNKVYSKSGENRLSNIEGHIVARATGALWLNEWVCSDGTPRGYYVVDVDGEKIEWHYHPCGNQLGVSNGLGDDYQMRVYSPSDYGDGYVYANVWAWDALWGSVLYTDNGPNAVAGRPMARIEKPGNLAKEEFKPDTNVKHLFRIKPSDGATSCTVEVTDRFGRRYSASLDWDSASTSDMAL